MINSCLLSIGSTRHGASFDLGPPSSVSEVLKSRLSVSKHIYVKNALTALVIIEHLHQLAKTSQKELQGVFRTRWVQGRGLYSQLVEMQIPQIPNKLLKHKIQMKRNTVLITEPFLWQWWVLDRMIKQHAGLTPGFVNNDIL